MVTGDNRTLAWDIDNRVDSITVSGIGTTTFEYDYTGMRTEKNAPSGITIFPFQGYEIDPNGVITKFIRIGIETFASKRGASKYFYHNDHLGGVNVITDINGNRVQLHEYDPWGKVSRSEGSIDPTHRFTGKELDPESGLYYYGCRYYDPELARFVSADPFVPRPGNPQALNRYSYTINNPVNYIDPTGFFFDKLFKAIGKFFKSIIKNPGVFIATLAVGVVTGGAALAAAPALGLAAGGIGASVLAGATGGFFAGGVGSAMSGGSFWKGAIIGLASGAVGGGVFSAAGGGFWGAVGGGFAGGITSGLAGTAFYGGNAFENAIVGGVTGAILAGGIYGIAKGVSYLASTAQTSQSKSALTTQESLNPTQSRNPSTVGDPDFYGKNVNLLEAAWPGAEIGNRIGEAGLRFVYRGSSTGVPTVEVTDYSAGVVEKIRFHP